MQFNFGTNHQGPPPDKVNDFGDYDTWDPFPTVWHMLVMAEAIGFLLRRIYQNQDVASKCDNYFLSLGRGRSFRQVALDPNVWVSYNAIVLNAYTGVTIGNEISIASTLFKYTHPFQQVAGTLLHEMGHVAGAPSHGRSAEMTLRQCGLEDQFDPTVIGLLGRLRSGTRA